MGYLGLMHRVVHSQPIAIIRSMNAEAYFIVAGILSIAAFLLCPSIIRYWSSKAIPSSIGWQLMIAAVVGIGLIVILRSGPATVLLAPCVTTAWTLGGYKLLARTRSVDRQKGK